MMLMGFWILPMSWKLNNVCRWRLRLHRLVFSLPMSPMHLWIVQQRRRRFLSLWNLPKRLGVLLEQGVDHFGNLASQAAHDHELSFVGSRAFVPAALDRNQALVEPGPFTILFLDGITDDEEEHLLHGSGSSSRQFRTVQCAARLSDGRSPAEVRFETGCTLEVLDVPNAGNNRRGLNGADRRNRGQDLPLAGVFDGLCDLNVELGQVLLQDLQLPNDLRLLDHQAPQSSNVLRSNALAG